MWLKPWKLMAALVVAGGYALAEVEGIVVATLGIGAGFVLGILAAAETGES